MRWSVIFWLSHDAVMVEWSCWLFFSGLFAYSISKTCSLSIEYVFGLLVWSRRVAGVKCKLLVPLIWENDWRSVRSNMLPTYNFSFVSEAGHDLSVCCECCEWNESSYKKHGIDRVLLGSSLELLLDWQWQSMGTLTAVLTLSESLAITVAHDFTDVSFLYCASQA